MKRPPIVVVMGHVDHGKTTLLDNIKKTNVAAKEAGGITQSVGAYEIVHNKEKITFIDTPGHEAFSKMRRRGGKAADIAILIVAADEGVKPQTKEAIKIIKESKLPFVVAVNKIDKNNADTNRIINELAQESVLLEGQGGDISWKEISAKTGQGVNELLDLILLFADVGELEFNSEYPAQGFILESYRDKSRGVVASVIVKEGTLKVGDELVSGSATAKIKMLENWQGKGIKDAQPSAPVLVLGFSEVPEVGTSFLVGGEADKKEAKERKEDEPAAPQDETTIINLILKASDSGSLEALADIINNLSVPDGYKFNIVDQSVGDITDGDVKLAMSAKALIIGFKVKINKAAENAAREHKIKIKTSKIVYELLQELEKWLQKFQQAAILGDLEILGVFGKKDGRKQVIGGKVVEGEISNNSSCKILRREKELGDGRIINLQKNKKDAKVVSAGNECGLLVSSDVDIRVGDHIVIYEDVS